MAWRVYAVVLLLACVAGCAGNPGSPVAKGDLFRQKNEGYSLLYELMGDESGVGRIFIFKHADDSVESLVRDIGKACQAAHKHLDEFRASDGRLEYDVSDLPSVEQRGRDLEARDDAKALLGSSGETFEVRLIFTQAEAMNYAVQLSRALSEKEDDPARKVFLSDLATQCANFYDQLMKMLGHSSKNAPH